MEFNWFGFLESQTHAHAPSTPSIPSTPSSSGNLADYGLAAVFAIAVLWGLMGPSHKSYKKEVRTRHVSPKRR